MIAIFAFALGGLVILFALLRPRVVRPEMLKEGQLAPDFSTEAASGQDVKPIRLSDYRGRTVILYFYPKDDTPGCTKEACSFRDGFARFERAGLVVLGCSVDTADSHKAFIREHRLPFALLLDPDRKIATAYGAANGIPILGLDRRITYVIGADGNILKVYGHVDPAVHASEILHDLGAEQRPSLTDTNGPS
jgi:thioredoxin-dependent peroxiredoxin